MNTGISIEVSNRQSILVIEPDRLAEAVHAVLVGESVDTACVSLAIVDDPTIHALNRRYLRHDYPTDVLSFVLEDNPLDGEIIVSAETAIRCAAEYDWNATDELTLYLIHGALHLVGYDDQDEDARREMRQLEQHYLDQQGIAFGGGKKGVKSP